MKLQSALLAAAIATLLGVQARAGDINHPEAIERALGLVKQNASLFQLAQGTQATTRSLAASASSQTTPDPSAGDQFQARDVILDADGTEHVRFNRFYKGLPVIGGDIVTHSRQAKLLGANLGLKTPSRPSIAPRISPNQAIANASKAFPGQVQGQPSNSLAIYARGDQPLLAYKVRVQGRRSDNVPIGDITYYIDANDGSVLGLDDAVLPDAATGSGRSLLVGTVSLTTDSTSSGYRLVDPSRGNNATYDALNTESYRSGTLFTSTTNTWGTGSESNRATVAVDVAYGVAKTWDYYKNTHDRNGIYNDGKGVNSYAHYGSNYGNAFWYDGAMYYGDGDGQYFPHPLVAIDVAGHEMSHGVAEASAGLGYYGVKDTGGLNEGNSDILGTLVEFYANNPNDPGDYLIGEKLDYTGGPLRLMFKQDADGYSYSCYPSGGFTASYTYATRKYDPHYTSGVANRFFYLLAEGAVTPDGYSYKPADLVCNGDTGLTGIGRTKAGKIWYRALTVYFTSTTTYPQARTATLNAATDLYGADSAEHAAVARAWSAVSVN